jgi:hypothetical protein
MTLKTDDLRAAVSAGLITEIQAASLSKLADERRGYRSASAQIDEPFELFKGFNEIFIVVGLLILYAGWSAITGVAIFDSVGTSEAKGASTLFLTGSMQIVFIALLAKYFTLKRRMIAPSILLSILFSFGAIQIGYALLLATNAPGGTMMAFTGGVTSVFLIIYWYFFRVPFSLLLTGLAIFALAIGLSATGGSDIKGIKDLFILTANTSSSKITIILGLCAFAVAMYFDMSDPHRVTRRAANAFWVHVLAAPAIVNSIALTLYLTGTITSLLLLTLFLISIALVAVIIDRRSFLISGAGYMIALILTVLDGGYGLVIFIIGGSLVLLGANWERLRCKLMNNLPDFRGKDKLPPWNSIQKETQ